MPNWGSIGNHLLNAATVVATVAGVSTAVVLVRREFFTPSSPSTATFTEIHNWRKYATAGQRLGSPNSPVVIVEWADYQCPFCRGAAFALDSVLHDGGGKVSLVFRNFPLPLHSHALDAARASECAARQGRFAQLHDLLFQRQDSIGLTSWWSFAKEVDIPDSVRFAECMRDSTVDGAIVADTVAGSEAGVIGTPTLLINSVRVQGNPGRRVLDSLVSVALKKSATSS